jgi:hypothetical protein
MGEKIPLVKISLYFPPTFLRCQEKDVKDVKHDKRKNPLKRSILAGLIGYDMLCKI